MTIERINPQNFLPLSGGTMTGNTVINHADPRIYLRDSDFESNVTSSGETDYVQFQDKNGTTIGRVNPWVSSGTQYMRYITQRAISGETKYNILNLGVNASGNAVVSISGTNAAASWRNAIGVSSIFTARVCSPSSAVSFPANATKDFTIPITAVSGYTPLLVSGFKIAYAKLLPLQIWIENATTISMTVQSFWTTAVSTVSIQVSVVYVRTELMGS